MLNLREAALPDQDNLPLTSSFEASFINLFLRSMAARSPLAFIDSMASCTSLQFVSRCSCSAAQRPAAATTLLSLFLMNTNLQYPPPLRRPLVDHWDVRCAVVWRGHVAKNGCVLGNSWRKMVTVGTPEVRRNKIQKQMNSGAQKHVCVQEVSGCLKKKNRRSGSAHGP